ncbi:MAG: DUF6132 family protein [Candidatus Omnitrophica bacterium]|nr:DUF6132 family protein [Candidatus Omnitrophota bacterium]
MKIIISVLIKALSGNVMGYLGKCSRGARPLTGTPIRGALGELFWD